jgi:hypothetical protein
LVTLVAYICRVDTQGDNEGESSLYLGLDVGQTHTGSLDGTPMGKTVWEIAPRRNSVKKVTNVIDPQTLSQPLPILISRCWISSLTSGFIVGRFG